MFVDHPPLCSRCRDKTETYQKLKYHDPDRPSAHIEARQSYIPRDKAQEFGSKHGVSRCKRARDIIGKTVKSTPGDYRPDLVAARLKWMNWLSSKVIPHVKPPSHSILHRRNSFPYIEHTRYSTPFSTPPLFPESLTLQRLELERDMANLGNRAIRRPRDQFCLGILPTLAGSELKNQPAQRASYGNDTAKDLITPPLTNAKSLQTVGSPFTPVLHPSPTRKPQKTEGSPLRLRTMREDIRLISADRSSTPPLWSSNPVKQSPTDVLHQRLGVSSREMESTSGAHSSYNTEVLNELSDFFASRSGKLLLPSRVVGRRG
jgi:hypothetical protein